MTDIERKKLRELLAAVPPSGGWRWPNEAESALICAALNVLPDLLDIADEHDEAAWLATKAGRDQYIKLANENAQLRERIAELELHYKQLEQRMENQ